MSTFLRLSVLLSGLVLSQVCLAGDAIVLSAAASLKPALSVLLKQFQAEHPGSHVRANYASSSQLAHQIEHGAKVDVFASADRKTMDHLMGVGQIRRSAPFAHSKLTVIFARKATGQQPSLEGLAQPETRLVMPSPKIPAATYIAEFIRKANAAGLAGGRFGDRLRANTVSEEPDARLVVAKVMLGEADAAIVYATDLTTDVRPKVQEVPIPPELNVKAEYMIGVVKRPSESADAEKLMGYILSSKGQAVLKSFGFATE